MLWAPLAAYVALVIIGALNHEMWRDEVRALSFAKDADSWSSLVSQLPGEGHPILWYALLRIGFALTHSNLVLPIAAIAAAAATAYLILRYAPFPLWLRLIAVFGAFLGHELSVSARNYGIGVMLMLLACVTFRRRNDRPMLLGAVLFLLANTSIHAALATLVILLYWAAEVSEPDSRSTLRTPRNLAGFVLAIVGVALAVIMARPTPDLAWAVSLTSLDYGKVLAAIFMDPGKGLLGYKVTSITAAGELPWRLLHVDPAIATRVIVDLSMAWLVWSLRQHRRALVVLIVAIVGFQIFFRTIYTASLRHEAIVLFLIFAICWMETERENDSRTIAFGLLPLFAMQAIALPVLITRGIRYAESSSKAYGAFIRSNPRYSKAILMSEPDYLMESMPYYVSNPVFMPRQGEFVDRVYFGINGRRRADLTLAELMTIADGVACTSKRTVLLAIGYPTFQFEPYGIGSPLYRGLTFSWAVSDWVRLGARSPVAAFPRAITDETYRVYEVSPGCS